MYQTHQIKGPSIAIFLPKKKRVIGWQIMKWVIGCEITPNYHISNIFFLDLIIFTPENCKKGTFGNNAGKEVWYYYRPNNITSWWKYLALCDAQLLGPFFLGGFVPSRFLGSREQVFPRKIGSWEWKFRNFGQKQGWKYRIFQKLKMGACEWHIDGKLVDYSVKAVTTERRLAWKKKKPKKKRRKESRPRHIPVPPSKVSAPLGLCYIHV